MLTKFVLRGLIILLSLSMSACHLIGSSDNADDQSKPITPQSGPWLNHKQSLEQLNGYQARGKFAYITNNKINSANFAWYQQSPNEYRLLLTTPFGNRIVELNVTPSLTQLTDDKNQIYINADAQTLIYELTGMQIPLHNLRQWLIGLPGESTDFQLNKNYRISQLNFTEGGRQWQVNYLGYNNQVQPSLPADLELTQEGHKIKIRISTWELQ